MVPDLAEERIMSDYRGITLCWAAKGGSGTTVVSAGLALVSEPPTVLIDMAGDLPAALGLGQMGDTGLGDWLATDTPAEQLADLTTEIASGVHLLTRGSGPLDGARERLDELLDHLAGTYRHVVIDAGTTDPDPLLAERADRRLLVTRACYLALRRALGQHIRPTGVVLVSELGRALRPVDVEAAIGAPIVADIAVDPSIARAVDAGLLAARLPRVLRRDLHNADHRAA